MPQPGRPPAAWQKRPRRPSSAGRFRPAPARRRSSNFAPTGARGRQRRRALAYALPAIEIVDSAIADWNIALADTVADNASCGLYVLGDQPLAVGAVSLGEVGMQLALNGSVASVGTGAACLDHPLRAAYWVVCEMLGRGHALQAGEIILSGALGPMVPVAAGDQIEVHIGALGSVACRMSA
ncbi:MAG TPA: fumarylacetoacetate hydrolase family protein [Arthrobacter sp.]